MTAEIAVLNKSAIALAADSAVTILNGTQSKIYNGAEKLFALTKYHPVGIMVYGTGSLCRVPWELIIKEYRKKLGRTKFDTLDLYAEDFFAFLSSEDKLIPEDLRDDNLKTSCFTAFKSLMEIVEDKVAQFISDNGVKPTDIETSTLIEETCIPLVHSFDTNDFLTGFDDSDLLDIKPKCLEYLEEILVSYGTDYSDAVKSIVVDLFALLACKKSTFGSDTGVVFAGYGDKEYFPVVLAFSVKGFAKDKLRRAPNPDKSAGAGLSGVIAYAQEEEVVTFLRGVNPRLHGQIESSYQKALDKILDKAKMNIDASIADDALKTQMKEGLVAEANLAWETAKGEILSITQKEYLDKVTQMVEFLPKDELGYMAESLVNMTAFKRKVSNESETVGGPIDVAIISKGDGFVWVRRKHYFDKELNNHYFSNFLRG